MTTLSCFNNISSSISSGVCRNWCQRVMNRKSIALWSFALLGAISSVWPACAYAQRKETVGWVERVLIHPQAIVVHAKLDTGADYSSLNAHDIEEFERDGKHWIRATVTNRFGNDSQIELPIRRYAAIKKHNAKTERRPVVRLKLCIGHVLQETDVNLVNRTNFEYQMLIGRSFLAGNLTIDPASMFTVEPSCKTHNSSGAGK